jgi:hypothetical protein
VADRGPTLILKITNYANAGKGLEEPEIPTL